MTKISNKREEKRYVRTRMHTYDPKWNDYFNKEDMFLLDTLECNYKDSYYVKGSASLLKKFELYYIYTRTYCLHWIDTVRKEPLYRYLNKLTEKRDDEGDLFLGANDEVLFLHEGKHRYDVGNSDEWYAKSTIREIDVRMSMGRVTILLSERDIPGVEKACGKGDPGFIFINLNDFFNKVKKNGSSSILSNPSSSTCSIFRDNIR